jgi:hypothetical protein
MNTSPLQYILKAGVRKLKNELQNEVKAFRMLLAHLDKRSYMIMFKKCSEPTCEHCSTHPVQKSDAMEFLTKYGIFAPMPYFQHDSSKHYMSFLECIVATDTGKSLALPDQFCPSL